ncbi:hypothetical protein KAW48_10190, partial [candidate division WOR-3 bacterium]|nr:hypothetical protein [candidate division WOR-3 bacterium]
MIFSLFLRNFLVEDILNQKGGFVKGHTPPPVFLAKNAKEAKDAKPFTTAPNFYNSRGRRTPPP